MCFDLIFLKFGEDIPCLKTSDRFELGSCFSLSMPKLDPFFTFLSAVFIKYFWNFQQNISPVLFILGENFVRKHLCWFIINWTLTLFKTQSKKLSVLLLRISNHKHKIEENFERSSWSSSKIVCFSADRIAVIWNTNPYECISAKHHSKLNRKIIGEKMRLI